MNATISRITGAPLRMAAFGGKMPRNPATISATDKTDLILDGYLRTLMEICRDAHIELDLTYRNRSELPQGNRLCVCSQSAQYYPGAETGDCRKDHRHLRRTAGSEYA